LLELHKESAAGTNPQRFQDLGLQIDGQLPGQGESLDPPRGKPYSPRAPIHRIRLPMYQAAHFHALEQRRHRVGIAGHLAGQFTLRQSSRGRLRQRSQDGVLVGGQFQVDNPAAEGLIQAEPSPTQEQRQASFGHFRRAAGPCAPDFGGPPV
jgi:hypothetical protein